MCVGVSRYVGVVHACAGTYRCTAITNHLSVAQARKSAMKAVCLLVLAVFNLSQAVLYRRTVSYEGELVAQW